MERRRGLSGAALKYLAALFMLVDHLDVVLNVRLVSGDSGSLAYYLLRDIGRPAFPIFLFFLAEGCRRTADFPKYLLRLGLFAALSEIPFRLASPGGGSSVLLTFFLGAAAVYGFERLQAKGTTIAALPLLGACVLALLLNTDYGFPAVLLLFALYLCGEDRRRQLICLSVGLGLIYLVYQPLTGLLSALPALWAPLVGGYLVSVLPVCAVYFICSLAGVLLLSRYNGTRGRGGKWFFYVFYPGHLLVLFLLRMILV